jgi:hypothetical protein
MVRGPMFGDHFSGTMNIAHVVIMADRHVLLARVLPTFTAQLVVFVRVALSGGQRSAGYVL